MFSKEDLDALESKGMSLETLQSQIDRFVTGFPFLRLSSSARVGNGIMRLTREQEDAAIARWNRYLSDGGEVSKFVPASGAASRMFKALFSFVNGDSDIPEDGGDVARLMEHISEVPFLAELNETLLKLHGKNVDALLSEKRYKDVVSAIILPDGMNYGNLPKAMLTFHLYPDGTTRTPLEEQLAEGAMSAVADGKVKLHFTVSGNHRTLFENKLSEAVPAMEARMGVKFDVSLSEQKPSTDTMAATMDNEPFRDAGGRIVFRPGGHGALIENLNDIDSAVVFIKNIDNVVPDAHRDVTIRYKQVIAGVLMEAHDKVDEFLSLLRSGRYSQPDLDRMVGFLRSDLCIDAPQFNELSGDDLAGYIESKLNRPLRVCGMVRNEGEPGGGPFMAYNPDGSCSPQILESTQIDMSVGEYKDMMSKATHFNPVDLVCYIKDVDGMHFNLPDYVDPDTGFISSKSLDGRELRALELPGLWNGAMSDWSTIFVEVPGATFNPVKTVNDLLRPAHKC